MQPKYTYRDWDKDEKRITKWTRGVFRGWTAPSGLMGMPYAVFRRPSGQVLLIAEYNVTEETMAKIGAPA